MGWWLWIDLLSGTDWCAQERGREARDGKGGGGGGKVEGVFREGRKRLPSTSSRLVWQHSWTSWTFLYKSCWVTCQKWHKFDRKYLRRFLSHLHCHHQQLLVLWPQKGIWHSYRTSLYTFSTTGIFWLSFADFNQQIKTQIYWWNMIFDKSGEAILCIMHL